MTLNSDERELLKRVAASAIPVQPSDFFHDIHPANFPISAPEDDPMREAWTEKQFGMYRALLRLHEMNLIEIVHPANGERGDLMVATSDGVAALG